LVDPNLDSGAHHADALRRNGYSVVVVADCDAALIALTRLTPRVIIVNFDSRTRDHCLAFCDRLKADVQTRAVPVLLTSDAINRDDLRRATNTKALVLSLGSPLDEMKLTSAVRGVLAVGEGLESPEDLRITRTA
jgi:CheY-like chemotaxis protein